jgi:hypothetical protein
VGVYDTLRDTLVFQLISLWIAKSQRKVILKLFAEENAQNECFIKKEVKMSRQLIALAFVLAGANTAIADDMKTPINSGDLKWGPAPPALPKGAEITVLSGDPSKDGPFVLRLKMPSGYKVPAHSHPTDESATVISGNFHIGMGDKFDENKAIELTAGGYAEAPAKMNHYGWVSSPSVVQLHGQGPFAITYVNSADDPSKQ